MSCKIVIGGYYGCGNIGDEVILAGLLSQIKEIFPDNHIVVLSGAPSQTERLHGVKAVNRFSFFQVAKEIFTSHLFILGGGGLFQDVTSFRSLFYYFSLVLLAKMMGKKRIIYAVGVGPLKRKASIFLTRLAMSWAHLASVRDFSSRKFLKTIGLKREVLLLADPAIALFRGKEFQKIKKRKKGKILLFIRNIPQPSLFQQIKEVKRTLEFEGKNFFVLSPNRPEDLNLLQKIGGMVRNIEKIEDLISLLSEMEGVISMSYHITLLCLILKVPVVSIGYDPKVNQLLKEKKYESALAPHQINPQRIKRKLKRAEKRRFPSFKEEERRLARGMEKVISLVKKKNF